MKSFGVQLYTNYAPQKCCGQTEGQTDVRTHEWTLVGYFKFLNKNEVYSVEITWDLLATFSNTESTQEVSNCTSVQKEGRTDWVDSLLDMLSLSDAGKKKIQHQ